MKHYRTINPTDKTSFNPFVAQGANAIRFQQETVYEAIVVDVITNDTHSEFAADGYNVGAVKFRNIKNDMYRNPEMLNWAFPLESNISEYPLLQEIVLVYTALNRFYYTRKLNVSNRVTAHHIVGLDTELSPAKTDTIPRTPGATASPQRQGTSQKNALGKYFQELQLARLRHDEGDVILEGRSGSSIRMGAAWQKNTNFQSTGRDQAPNILFRVGPDTRKAIKPEFGQTVEDINSDASSLYLVTDQLIPLKYATEQATTHRASIKDFPKRLDGTQIVINTDRIVLNSRKDKLFGFALAGIHWTSAKDFTIDADRNSLSKIGGNLEWNIGNDAKVQVGNDLTFTIGSIAEIEASKILLGGSAQPAVGGKELADFLEKILKIFIANSQSFISPLNPKAINPIVVAEIQQLVGQLVAAPFNSSKVFLSL